MNIRSLLDFLVYLSRAEINRQIIQNVLQISHRMNKQNRMKKTDFVFSKPAVKVCLESLISRLRFDLDEGVRPQDRSPCPAPGIIICLSPPTFAPCDLCFKMGHSRALFLFSLFCWVKGSSRATF